MDNTESKPPAPAPADSVARLDAHAEQIDALKRALEDARAEAERLRTERDALARSTAFRLGQRAIGVGTRVAPPGSRRRAAVRRLLSMRRQLRPRRVAPAAQPRLTLILPAASLDLLSTTAQSIAQQDDPRWELLVTGPAEAIPEALPAQFRSIPVASGLADALNAALAAARGEFVAVVNAGDELRPHATSAMLRAAKAHRADIVYSDEDVLPDSGPPGDAFAKPDWSPELLLSFPYTSRLCLIRTTVARHAGGWRRDSTAAEDYALVLAASRAGATIRRAGEVLYRRRGRRAADVYSTADAVAARRAALHEHLHAASLAADVVAVDSEARLRVKPRLRDRPLISIIIATRDRLPLLQQCVSSIEHRTSYSPYEIVIVDNDSREPETLEYLARSPHRVVRVPGPFNFSAINNAGARAARGEYLLFLNNDTETIEPGWLEAMLEWAAWPGIGCVGAKLLFPDGKLQHVGVTLHDGSAYHPHYGERELQADWLDTQVVRNYSAVTAACVLVSRAAFEAVGGFDETFPVAYNDVILNVRILQKGYRNLYTPYASLVHHESASRPPGVKIEESEHLQQTLGGLLWSDPYCASGEGRPQPPGRATLARARRVASQAAGVLKAATSRRTSLRALIPTATEPDGKEQVRWMDQVEIDGVRLGALFMHPVARRTYRVPARAKGSFGASIALMPQVWEKNRGGVLFRVGVKTNGVEQPVREWLINPNGKRSHERWTRISVPLPVDQSGEAEVTLATAFPPGASPAHAWAVWGDPHVNERKALGEVAQRQAQLVRALGWKAAARRYARLLLGRGADPQMYDGWFKSTSPQADALSTMRQAASSFAYRPTISIITPVYNTDPKWLLKCVESAIAQVYPNWELCLGDDGSTRRETLKCLEKVGALDPRIKVVTLPKNGGISAASNAALGAATGEFIALLDHDDELAPDALFEVAQLLNRHRDADVIYTDEDKLEFDGTHSEPFFKPDWSPEYLRSTMYVGHLTIYRRRVIEAIGGFRSACDGAQDYDLALRASEVTTRIFHIPKVLYHWRKIQGSAAGDASAKPWGLEAARRALSDHVAKLPYPAAVADEPGRGFFRVRYDIIGEPLVSIVIPTDGRIAQMRGGRRDLLLECLRSIAARTEYPNYEVVVVDNGRVSREVLATLANMRHRRVVYQSSGPFNFAAKVNFAVSHAAGEHVLLLNDDTEVINEEWLTAMVEFSQQSEVGAVGGKLFFPDGRIQHVGVVLGIGGGACHVLSGLPGDTPGYFGGALVIRNYSAVTGACCMTRRAVFDEVGGFDERFALDFNDVDYCLRVGARGYRIVGTPFARLLHFEGATFGSREHIVNPDEVAALSERWGGLIEADPYYNPNLTRSALDYSLRLSVSP